MVLHQECPSKQTFR
ncbi:unnamed protein product, partial [Allacma fusca]